MNIILASKSPRRKELLEQIGIIPEIIVSEADENIDEKDPKSLVMKLSKIKAEAVFDDVKERNEEFCVLGADTVVFADDSILGKPENKEEARRMIKGLQGKYQDHLFRQEHSQGNGGSRSLSRVPGSYT